MIKVLKDKDGTTLRFPLAYQPHDMKEIENWLKDSNITEYSYLENEQMALSNRNHGIEFIKVIYGIKFKRERDFQLFYLTWC